MCRLLSWWTSNASVCNLHAHMLSLHIWARHSTYPWVVCLMLRISCILCSSLSFKCHGERGFVVYNAHMHNGKMCPAAWMWNRIEPFGKVHACLHYLSDPPRCLSSRAFNFSIPPPAAARAFADADLLFYIIEECATQMFGSTFYQCVWMRCINLNFSYGQ
jgi:hypothetical protein